MMVFYLLILTFFSRNSLGAGSEHHVFSLSSKETWIETVRVPDKMSNEAILFAPIGGRFAYLMSSKGTLLKKWAFRTPIYNVTLDNEGNLLALYQNEHSTPGKLIGAVGTFNKDGKLLWEYKNPYLHHSIAPTKNNTVQVIVAQNVTDSKFKKDPFLKSKKLDCDSILEIDKKNNVLWSVNLYDLVKVDISRLKKKLEIFSSDYLSICHTNSVREYDKTPFSAESAILVSLKNLDLIMLIEKKTKKVLWQNAPGTSSDQHDARLIRDWIYIFNNGPAHLNVDSEIVRFNVLTNKREVVFKKKSFMYQSWGSLTKSGVIPLKNGNYLIVLGDPGQMWEVTAEDEIVRKISVLSSMMPYEMGSTLFTAEVYEEDFLKSKGLIE